MRALGHFPVIASAFFGTSFSLSMISTHLTAPGSHSANDSNFNTSNNALESFQIPSRLEPQLETPATQVLFVRGQRSSKVADSSSFEIFCQDLGAVMFPDATDTQLQNVRATSNFPWITCKSVLQCKGLTVIPISADLNCITQMAISSCKKTCYCLPSTRLGTAMQKGISSEEGKKTTSNRKEASKEAGEEISRSDSALSTEITARDVAPRGQSLTKLKDEFEFKLVCRLEEIAVPTQMDKEGGRLPSYLRCADMVGCRGRKVEAIVQSRPDLANAIKRCKGMCHCRLSKKKKIENKQDTIAAEASKGQIKDQVPTEVLSKTPRRDLSVRGQTMSKLKEAFAAQLQCSPSKVTLELYADSRGRIHRRDTACSEVVECNGSRVRQIAPDYERILTIIASQCLRICRCLPKFLTGAGRTDASSERATTGATSPVHSTTMKSRKGQNLIIVQRGNQCLGRPSKLEDVTPSISNPMEPATEPRWRLDCPEWTALNERYRIQKCWRLLECQKERVVPIFEELNQIYPESMRKCQDACSRCIPATKSSEDASPTLSELSSLPKTQAKMSDRDASPELMNRDEDSTISQISARGQAFSCLSGKGCRSKTNEDKHNDSPKSASKSHVQHTSLDTDPDWKLSAVPGPHTKTLVYKADTICLGILMILCGDPSKETTQRRDEITPYLRRKCQKFCRLRSNSGTIGSGRVSADKEREQGLIRRNSQREPKGMS